MTENRIVCLLLAAVFIALAGCTAEIAPAADVVAPSPTVEIEPTIEDTAVDDQLDQILETPILEAATRDLDPGSLFVEEESLDIELIVPQDPAAKGRISFARTDLAQKLDIDAADIEVVAYEETVWRDGSLGCPKPDMMYTQALVDGYFIQLSVDGQLYNYHGANGRDPFLCTNNLN